MRFTNPLALILLLTLPGLAWLGWPARGYNRLREIFSLVTRMILAFCLILALAGLEITNPRKSDSLAVVFLVDLSDSMPPIARQAAEEYIQKAIQAMKPEDQAAIVAFAGEALVDRPMSPGQVFRGIASIPTSTQTDLAEAIQLAMALFPAESARRMVILSDGAITTGDATNAARLAAQSGVEVQVVPIMATSGAEVLVSRLQAPTQLRQGDRFDLHVTIETNQATQVQVRVFAGGILVLESEETLNKGVQTLSLPLTALQTGFVPYQVQVIPLGPDTHYQNNELSTYSQVSGPPKILVVAPPSGESLGFHGEIRPDEYTPLVQSLKASGFTVELIQPYGLPSELVGFVEYAAVVLVDVPARQLNSRQMMNLQAYVRDLGGGLITVGGPTSYGVGGYFRTPLEKILPVDMQIKDEQHRPTLTMIFIIDHSGSMSETSGGVMKLELAKEAAIRSVELLQPSDKVGVIAFDDAATWVVPITEVTDPGEIQASIGTLRIGGGTDILAGLRVMADELPHDDSLSKHVILLTDGGANPAGIPELVEEMNRDYGITLSTVGVGRDAAAFLPNLAELGGGRYHFAADPGAIPTIFTEETILATRAYIVEEQFVPQLASNSPILTGITIVPPLLGYVGTSAKENAQTILISDKGDPILAAWRYGLGKSVAFTSDATGRWASSWVPWEGFATFWAQAVRYAVGDRLLSGMEVDVDLKGENARLIVDATRLDPGSTPGYNPQFLNGYLLQANIVNPNGETLTMELRQIAPGRYVGDFQPEEEGVYLIHISGQSPQQGETALAETTGWVLSYSPEYRLLTADPDALLRVALAANGRLAEADPAEAFAHTLKASVSHSPFWHWLLILAMALLPLDIGIRRLVINRADILRSFDFVRGEFHNLILAPSIDQDREARLERLLRAKQRAESIHASTYPAELGQPTFKQPLDQHQDESQLRTKPAISPSGIEPVTIDQILPPPSAQPKPTPSVESKEPVSSTTATLLAKKRMRKRN